MAISWTYWPSDPSWYGSDPQGYWDTRQPWIRPVRPGSIRWQLRRTVDPTSEPVPLTLAKLHLRVDISDDDQLISYLISAAREYVEMRTGMALMPSTWQLVLDRWPRQNALEFWPWPGIPVGAILLPRFPVNTVTSVVWYGADGSTNTVTATDYIVDTSPRPPAIVPAYTKSWPAQTMIPKAGIITTFTAGYANLASVPPTLVQAILMLMGHWYENRETVMVDNRLQAISLPHALDALLAQWVGTLVG